MWCFWQICLLLVCFRHDFDEADNYKHEIIRQFELLYKSNLICRPMTYIIALCLTFLRGEFAMTFTTSIEICYLQLFIRDSVYMLLSRNEFTLFLYPIGLLSCPSMAKRRTCWYQHFKINFQNDSVISDRSLVGYQSNDATSWVFREDEYSLAWLKSRSPLFDTIFQLWLSGCIYRVVRFHIRTFKKKDRWKRSMIQNEFKSLQKGIEGVLVDFFKTIFFSNQI